MTLHRPLDGPPLPRRAAPLSLRIPVVLLSAAIVGTVLVGAHDFLARGVHHRDVTDCVAFGGRPGDSCVTADGASHPWPSSPRPWLSPGE